MTDPTDAGHANREYRRALGILWQRSAWERGLVADPFGGEDAARRGLLRTRAFVDALGAPDRSLPLLHIAGSKGKGSTAAMAAAALSAAGFRTGLYTSPHLNAFHERVAINGRPAGKAPFAALAFEADAAAAAVEASRPDLGQVTTFELLTGMAFLAFARAGCAVAVIEVGLGGEWDATNVIDPAACAITRIDLEHTAILGDTLAAIASAKAGIIKPARPVAIGPNAPEAEQALLAAGRTASEVLLAGRDWSVAGEGRSVTIAGPWGVWPEVSLALAGDHQAENAGTAAAALWLLRGSGIVAGEAAVREGFATVHWAGRFERIAGPGGAIVLDGAHTPAAAVALRRTIEREFPGIRADLVLGCATDKPLEAIVAALAPVARRVIAVAADTARAADPSEVAAAAARAGLAAQTAGSVAEGLAAAAGAPLALVTGSLYVVGEAREALGLAEPDPAWGPELVDGPAGPLG